MAASSEGKDETSIKPVSSLRSRFENLGNSSATKAVSSIPPRGYSTEIERSSWKDIAVDSSEAQGVGDKNKVQIRGLERLSPSSEAKSRPQSMIHVSPSHLSTIDFNTDPPASPGKLFPHSGGAQHALGRSHGKSFVNTEVTVVGANSNVHTRTLSRAATPTFDSRTSPLLQAARSPKAQSDGIITGPPSPDLSARQRILPTINRAGKPNVPKKPPALTQKPANLSASQPEVPEYINQTASPFGTPPGSGPSSPAGGGLAHSNGEVGMTIGAPQRYRGQSDASFVETVRSDSDDSYVGRFRGDSDASLSFTKHSSDIPRLTGEPSSMSETEHHWNLPPSTHQHVAAQRKSRSNGVIKYSMRSKTIDSAPPSLDGDQPDQRPCLPARPELRMRPGRTSPTKGQSGRISPVKALHLRRTATVQSTSPRIPATKQPQRSALDQGFSQIAPPMLDTRPHMAPAVPAPRRSADKRRDVGLSSAPNSAIDPPMYGHPREEEIEPIFYESATDPSVSATDYPDSSQASRRPPMYRSRPHHIHTEYDTRLFTVCGQYVCTTGYQTRVWDMQTGEQLLNMPHNDMVRITALTFKPSAKIEDEGKRIWLGTSIGDIIEVDIPSQSVVRTKTGAHARREIIRMFRYASELWTLDEGGDFNVWKPDTNGVLTVDAHSKSFRTPRGHTASIALAQHLWLATGKGIRVYAPSARSDSEFQVLRDPLSQPGTGDIRSATTLSNKPDLVYFGHQDGKVSIYNRHDFSCAAVVNVSMYKLSTLTGIGDYLWAGFHTGMIYVYDTSTNPWRVKKDWKAHDKHICGIMADRSSIWKMDRLQVVTLGTDNLLKIWDGTLEEDWLDARMKEHDSQYCSFEELTAAVLTWNAGASKPHYLQQDKEDDNFFRDYLASRNMPDVFVFGFQELIDLEDKRATAKSFFKSKKKDASEQEHIGHQYRAWRDYLTRCLDEHMPTHQTYALLHAASLVGLFTCVFVKSSIRNRVKHVHAAEVKRGMGGHHGNKGALVLRMVIDDSSLCFINCHLAAGQTQTAHRNNDIAEILETEALPRHPLSTTGVAQHSDVFTSGGDGSMILDHEICILNGDLNYRIDSMGRDTVIKHVQQNNLSRLLERDQLLLSRKKNAGNRLRAFQESTITFAPTYKYDVHSDRYDTSEKRRAPAWCDRILYRGLGKVKMEEYRRWEVRVSDHRPVSGILRLRVKIVDASRRSQIWEACQRDFEAVRKRTFEAVQIEHLSLVLSMSQNEALAALKI